MAEEKKSGFRLHALNPMVLLGIIMFLAFLASYIVPAGEYSRVLNPVLNKEVVDPESMYSRSLSFTSAAAYFAILCFSSICEAILL